MTSYPYPIADVAGKDELISLHPLLSVASSHPNPCPPDVGLPDKANISGFTRTSHLVPAAFPRNLPPTSPLRSASTHSYQIDTVIQSLGSARQVFQQRKYQGIEDSSSQVQWNCVDRYVPHFQNKTHDCGITLFLCHSAGFYRQVWEPMLKHLLSNPSGATIREIWSFEAVQHGDSAVINDEAQRDIVDWHDASRDILNFLVNYLPINYSQDLKKVLQPIPESDRAKGRRKVVAIGHSFGGTVLARAALEKPHLFDALILVEPMIFSTKFQDSGPDGFKALHFLLRTTLQKLSSFSSREHAEEYFRRNLNSARWHPDVLENFLQHGLTPCQNGPGVRLKTRPFDEAVVTYGWRSGHEVWSALADLDARVALHWIMSGKGATWTGGRAMTQRTVWRRPLNASNVLVDNAGHSIPQEHPDSLASHISNFLNSHYSYKRRFKLASLTIQALLPWLSPLPKL